MDSTRSLKPQFTAQPSRLVGLSLAPANEVPISNAEIYKLKDCKTRLLACELFMTHFAYYGEIAFISISGFRNGKEIYFQ